MIEGIALITNTIPGMVLGLAFLFCFSGTSLQSTFLILVLCNMIHYFSTPYLMMKAGILFSLKCWGEQSQRQLAQRVGITPPSMTVALRKMEEKGYVSRKTDEKDQRITRIQLAPKGEECIDGIRRVLTEMEEIIYQGISREEVLLMKRLLTEMKNNLLESKDFKGVDMQTIMEKTHPSMKHM